MRRRYLKRFSAALALLLATASLGSAQPATPFYYALAPSGLQQFTLRYDNAASPNTINVGCGESEVLGGTTINGIDLKGAATGNAVTIAAHQCPGGDANIGITLTPLGTGSVVFGGTGGNVTHTTFYPAANYCKADSTNVLTTRIGPNDWALTRTAAGAETYNFLCSFPLPFRPTASKGARIDSFALSYQVTVLALTTHTFTNLATRTFANNVANAVAAYGGAATITLATAVQANPYLTTGTLAAPAFMTTTNTEVNMEWQAVLQNTTVYRVYGVQINWTEALY